MKRDDKLHCSIIPHFIIALLITLSLMGLPGCSIDLSGKKPPNAVAGVLDLRDWDFARDGNVLLKGEAEFYWMKMLEPDDFMTAGKAGQPDFLQIPGPWKGQTLRGKRLPGPGYATYRLTILVNNPEQILGMKFLQMSEACMIYINGRMVEARGVTGTSTGTTTPAYSRGMISFSTSGKNTLELIINASNYFEKMGAATILLGRNDDIQRHKEDMVATDIFLFSTILLMGLYHLSMFLFRKKDKSTLYFGVYCLLIAYFTVYNGERFIFNIFPGADWDFVYRLMHLSVFISVAFFGMFLHALFPQEFPQPVVRILQITGALFSLVVIAAPLNIYPRTMAPYQVIIILACVYTIYALISAARHGRDGSIIFLGGFFILFMTVVNDVLSDNKIIHTGNIIPLGLFIFIFSQTWILSIRFSRSFAAVERLSGELQEKNIELSKTWYYLTNVFNSLPSMLISVNREVTVTQWNTAAERYSGIPASNAISKKLWDIVPHLGNYRAVFNRVFETNMPEELRMESVEDNKGKKYFNISINPLHYDDIEGLVVRVDDMTELEKKDSQLRQAQKMEIIGTLAGGLAHDFNNVLGGISGGVSLIKHDLGKPDINIPRIMEMATLLEESSVRAASLVQQLLSLSRKHEPSPVPVDLNRVLARVLHICATSFDKSIEIRSVGFGERAMVKADPAQIEQVILNLCINASHAMTIMRKEDEPEGGALTVSIERIYADKFFCETHPEAHPGRYWMISHRDTGVGMDSKTIAKIFDPFFSTKKTGKGTGLGLAMVYNTVQQHGGFIDVYSEPGYGSTFNVFLPELEDGEITANETAPEQPIEKGAGLILLVDDEEAIRRTAAHMLEEFGYRVLTAVNGEEAIGIFRNRHKDIRAVVLDMAMPRKSGMETFMEMKTIDPSVKVLLTSGFRQDERVQKIMAHGVDEFIQKPYTMVDLSRKIKKIIG